MNETTGHPEGCPCSRCHINRCHAGSKEIRNRIGNLMSRNCIESLMERAALKYVAELKSNLSACEEEVDKGQRAQVELLAKYRGAQEKVARLKARWAQLKQHVKSADASLISPAVLRDILYRMDELESEAK